VLVEVELVLRRRTIDFHARYRCTLSRSGCTALISGTRNNQPVLVLAGLVAVVLQDRRGADHRLAVLVLALVPVIGVEHHEAEIRFVRDVLASGEDVDSCTVLLFTSFCRRSRISGYTWSFRSKRWRRSSISRRRFARRSNQKRSLPLYRLWRRSLSRFRASSYFPGD
jgi:hypothetical protein